MKRFKLKRGGRRSSMISNQREVNNQRDRSQIGQTLRQTDRDFTEPDREGGGVGRRERERKREGGGGRRHTGRQTNSCPALLQYNL